MKIKLPLVLMLLLVPVNGWTHELTEWQKKNPDSMEAMAKGSAGYSCRQREWGKCWDSAWGKASFWKRHFGSVGDNCPSARDARNYKEICDEEVRRTFGS